MWETVCRRDRRRRCSAPSIGSPLRGYANASGPSISCTPLAGATSIYARSRLDRCLRDVHTAAAHVWVAPDTYELAGRLLLGLDPNSTTI